MKAAITGVLSALGRRKLLASSGAFAALAALTAALLGGDALAQNAGECARLQQAIAQRHGSSGVQAAAERQRAELARTSAYARSLGCENRKFLFLGSDPPAQCGQLNGQIARMQANLADLRGARRRRSGRSRRALQRGMPQRPGKTQQYLRGFVRRRREARASAAADGRQSRTARRRIAKPSPARGEAGSRGACRVLRGLRAHLRRQLLSRVLYGRRKPGR